MTDAWDPIVEFAVRVPLLASDRDFILGALNERIDQAQAQGHLYTITDFIREALIEAAQR